MMPAAVFDTNVIVSGALSPHGFPGRLLDAVLDGYCRPVVSDAILSEYEEVLSRPKFRLPVDKIRLLLSGIREQAQFAPFVPLTNAQYLPDPDDRIFIEAARALRVTIVTGNSRHFPRRAVNGLSVLTPSDFFRTLSERP